MDVLVQYPSKIRASCDHGWVNDKLDSGMKGCNLVEDVGNKFVDDLVLLLPLPLDKCEDNRHSLEEPEDINPWQVEAANDVFQTCSEGGAMASNMDSDCASNMETNVHNIVKPIAMEIKSAMKGSRQQHGLEKKTTSVSWAPDVYDPPVTSECHLVKANSRKHSRLRKKSSKPKRKGKSIRNGSKVKK